MACAAPHASLDMTTPTISQRRYSGVSADERRAQRHERLLQAAYEVFGVHGYRLTTMRLICAQARLADRYFHEHFATVHECFKHVHDRTTMDVSMAVEEAICSLPPDLLTRARGALQTFFEQIRQDPRRARILIQDASNSGLTAEDRVAQQYAFIVDLLRARFRQKYPALQGYPNIDLIISGCIGMVSHTTMLWIERGFDLPVETLIDHNLYAWTGLDQWLSSANATALQKTAQRN